MLDHKSVLRINEIIHIKYIAKCSVSIDWMINILLSRLIIIEPKVFSHQTMLSLEQANHCHIVNISEYFSLGLSWLQSG